MLRARTRGALGQVYQRSGATCDANRAVAFPDRSPLCEHASVAIASTGTTALSGPIGLLSILALGFVLGMRHATDADHVVAISTIVTQQRRTRSAAWIGALWGLGHTITIFAVGVGIIVFTLAIPPRVGLSMELSVGLMLVLLGLINLLTVGKAGAEAAAQ